MAVDRNLLPMKFSLRTLILLMSLATVLIGIPGYIWNSVLPENRYITSELVKLLGKRYEATGEYPKSTSLTLGDIGGSTDLRLLQNSNGVLTNRWGQEIGVSGRVPGECEGTQILVLSVSSSGPWGMIATSESFGEFEYELPPSEQQSTAEYKNSIQRRKRANFRLKND